jgi:hypothetical protein
MSPSEGTLPDITRLTRDAVFCTEPSVRFHRTDRGTFSRSSFVYGEPRTAFVTLRLKKLGMASALH